MEARQINFRAIILKFSTRHTKPERRLFFVLAWKGLSVFARTSASHLRVVPGGTVERMTRIGARPEDCSISFTTSGMVDHTYC